MKFKVGDRVEHEFYGKGTVIGVGDIDAPLVEFDVCQHEFHDGGPGEVNGTRGKDGHCWFTDMIKPIESQTIVIYPKGLETVALLKEGGKIIKQTSAKCNSTDVYDFEVGAKLAFRRLMGEDTILVVNPNEPALSTFDWEGFKQGKFAVHCDTEDKAMEFLKEAGSHGIRWNNGELTSESYLKCFRNVRYYFSEDGSGMWQGDADGYKGNIIDYIPSIREVKRPAKVEEWIKIISEDGHNNGTGIFKVTDILCNPYGWVYVNGQTNSIIRLDQYVVPENYQPEEATKPSLSMYTDKELIDELAKRWEDKQ